MNAAKEFTAPPCAHKTLNVADMIARQQQDKRRMAAIGPKAPPRAKRSPGKFSKPQQKAVRELLITELESLRRDIMNKRRETPAWAHGYDSALSTINARIEALR